MGYTSHNCWVKISTNQLTGVRVTQLLSQNSDQPTGVCVAQLSSQNIDQSILQFYSRNTPTNCGKRASQISWGQSEVVKKTHCCSLTRQKQVHDFRYPTLWSSGKVTGLTNQWLLIPNSLTAWAKVTGWVQGNLGWYGKNYMEAILTASLFVSLLNV